ncbi:hypothetical protein TSUD_145390 [Trifolium subterraneum]|uniref:PB1 domain-containing protein n=1 Tax=Trifolium subterraneum TaxID=3900 RepID=A0A2Z6N175_TRISU|nr:hypothetical protein TSUD_145390 [Trifolium subterraneum]
MDPQLLSTASTTNPPNMVQQNYPESVESLSSPSPPQPPPRSREIMNEESLPNVPGSKLRLMCSYGGHIMPRPHDKSLCYVGGDTRIVVVDRSASLRDLCSRLSRTILNGRPFTLKYQLPNEDLDNLITVTSDEDLDNMIEEYDRIASSAMKPSSSRLRVFLFFTKPDSTLSMGSLLDDAKSETWFVDALNNSGILSRGVSDSAGDSFVNLDNIPASDSSNNLESQGVAAAESLNILEDINNNNNNVKNVFDVVNVAPGSPMLENSLSSSSLSPSMANLPPIRVRVDETGGSRLQQENKVGMKQDGGYVVSYANVAMGAIPSAGVVTTTATVSDVNLNNRVVSDDERSDYGGVIGSRKPPLPLQLVQPRTGGGGLSVPSPDSVTSDSSSIASTNSFSKIVYHQEQVQPTNIDNNKAQDSSYMLPPQMDQNQQLQQPPQQQQQFVHSNTHYIHHPTTTNQVPISSYYQVYPPQSQQQQIHNPIGQQQIGQQQYPIYVMPIGSTQQPYNMTLQHNINDPNVVASSRPIIPQSGTPPIYPNKSPNPNVASNSTFVQVPSNQFQQQYVGLPQFHHQPQHPINVAPSSGTNYGYEYGGNVEGQVYYTQQQTNAPLVTQYQSMTPAAAAAALSDASNQFPADNVQQPNRTSQPV